MSDETQFSPRPALPADPNVTAAAETARTGPAAAPHDETLAQTPEQVQRTTSTFAVSKVAVPGYELLSELGRGGMGVVYKARHIKLNRVVALKMILAGGHANERDIARFVAEAEAVAAIRHPNVIQVFDSGEAQGHPFMAMECLEGGSLSQRLRAGKMDPRAAAELMERVARGVQAAHERGIVHRDLKPHNILLDSAHATAEPWGEPKVMDFGLAKRDGAELTQTGAVLGTPAYMAPEQAKGDTKAVGPAADVYALGVILYECLTGSVPFKGSDVWSVIRQVVDAEPEAPMRRAPGVPRDLSLICLKCLAKELAERYASAQALADDLRRYLNGERPLGPRTGVWDTARRAVRKRWRPVAAVSALLALVVVAWFLPSPFGKKEDPVTALLRKEVTHQVEVMRETEPSPDRDCPHPFTDLPELPRTDYSRFKVFKDERFIDLRGWKPLDQANPNDECSVVYFTRREMMKVSETNELRAEVSTSGRDVICRALRPNADKARVFRSEKPARVGGQALKLRHLAFDVSDVPLKGEFTLRYTCTYWNSLQTPEEQWFGVIGYEGAVKTSMLVLFPDGKPYRDYKLMHAPLKPGAADEREDPRPYTGSVITFGAPDRSWLYWEIPNPQAKHIYRVDWTW